MIDPTKEFYQAFVHGQEWGHRYGYGSAGGGGEPFQTVKDMAEHLKSLGEEAYGYFETAIEGRDWSDMFEPFARYGFDCIEWESFAADEFEDYKRGWAEAMAEFEREGQESAGGVLNVV